MDHAVLVGIVQGVGHLAGDAERFLDRELLLPQQPAPERLAVHIRHGEPELPVGLARVVHHQDVGMLQPGAEPDLAEEPLGAQDLGQVGMEDLERDRSVMLQVVGQKDGGHSAASQLPLDPVAVGQRRLEAIQHRPR